VRSRPDAFHRLDRAWMGGDAAMMASTSDPLSWLPSQAQEYLTYTHDQANNRTASSGAAGTTSYAREADSNRYEKVSPPGAASEVVLEYDERGNLKYDGRYDYLNRLQEVWRVLPTDAPPEDGEKFVAVQQGALDDAEESVKLEVPDLLTRLAREHTNPTFRSRLKASIAGGVIRITPTPQGGGGRPGWLPVTGTLELSAVYLYDAFNRRVTSILVGRLAAGDAAPDRAAAAEWAVGGDADEAVRVGEPVGRAGGVPAAVRRCLAELLPAARWAGDGGEARGCGGERRGDV
jgi:hypothetical protein